MTNLSNDNDLILESPFLELPISEINTENLSNTINDEMVKSPLMDPSQLKSEIVSEDQPDALQFAEASELNDYEMMEHQVAPSALTTKVGDMTFSIDSAKASSDEYKEPILSGNPLLIILPNKRTSHISKNFLVGEFAQAQSGKYKFNFARIDPLLVDNIQRLRSFVGKQMGMVDGYYSPKYLKEVLKVKESPLIMLNPHITGRAVKINVPGYNGILKQIAIAAIVACDKNINIGIGASSMTLAVKQALATDTNIIPEDFQRITSYITDEKIKVATYTFCVDVKKILHDHYSAYEKDMHKAVSAFTVNILKTHYSQSNIPPEWLNWETHVRNVISFMYDKSITKDPNVILYCLAYSPFGNLYRYYFKDKSNRNIDTVNSIIKDLTTDNDRKLSNVSGNFIPSQNAPDKTNFIDTCRTRIQLGKKSDGSAYRLVPATFFDWKDNPKDKNFLDNLSGIIKDVYFTNNYHYAIPVQQSPVGGTKRNLTISDPNPDKPVNDFTGRYWAQFPADDKTLYGRYVVINQAGNYIAGKFGGIYKFPVKNLRNTITEFYGKIDGNGEAVCHVIPQQTLKLKKVAGGTRLVIENNANGKVLLSVPVISRSANPVISNRIVNSFSYISKNHQDLLLTLAWVQPLPSQLKTFFDSFKKSEKDIVEAIYSYYNEDETVPNVKKNKLSGYMSKLDVANNNYLKLPPMFIQFATYYTKYVYSVSEHWSPTPDRETRSTLDWIKKMLEDYRDFTGSANIEKRKSLYDYFGVDTKIPAVLYQYKVKMKLSAYGFGPFARSSGTITIENKTDYNKYPKAQKWSSGKNSEDFPITLWNATLSLNPGKWLPKISSGQSIDAEGTTSAYYSATDFSGAGVQVTEGKVFEIPLSKNKGNVKTSTKIGIGGVVVLIDGHGKKTLELTEDMELKLPDTIEIEPSSPSGSEDKFEKIAGFLPSITMYKGSIGTKATSLDIVSVPLPDSYKTSYQMENTKYFIHDDATLTAQAIEAVGRMCAEELAAFSDPNSQVEIYGHADASGDPVYNKKLSEARAANTRLAIEDRLGKKLKAKIIKVIGFGEEDANKKFGQYTQKNAWLRRVIVIINGRAVLSLGEI